MFLIFLIYFIFSEACPKFWLLYYSYLKFIFYKIKICLLEWKGSDFSYYSQYSVMLTMLGVTLSLSWDSSLLIRDYSTIYWISFVFKEKTIVQKKVLRYDLPRICMEFSGRLFSSSDQYTHTHTYLLERELFKLWYFNRFNLLLFKCLLFI